MKRISLNTYVVCVYNKCCDSKEMLYPHASKWAPCTVHHYFKTKPLRLYNTVKLLLFLSLLLMMTYGCVPHTHVMKCQVWSTVMSTAAPASQSTFCCDIVPLQCLHPQSTQHYLRLTRTNGNVIIWLAVDNSYHLAVLLARLYN